MWQCRGGLKIGRSLVSGTPGYRSSAPVAFETSKSRSLNKTTNFTYPQHLSRHVNTLPSIVSARSSSSQNATKANSSMGLWLSDKNPSEPRRIARTAVQPPFLKSSWPLLRRPLRLNEAQEMRRAIPLQSWHSHKHSAISSRLSPAMTAFTADSIAAHVSTPP